MSVESYDRIGPIAHDWDDLADRTKGAPWLRPGWIEAWWKAFGAGRLKVLAIRRGGRLAGLVPLCHRAGVLCSTTNPHTPEFGLLAEDGAAARQLADALFRDSSRRVSLALIDAGKPDLSQCRAAAAAAGYRVLERRPTRSPYLETHGDWGSYEKGMSRNLRQDLRRRRGKLEQVGSISFEFCDGRDRLDELLEEGFGVEASGWKGARGTAIVSRPETHQFYTEIARWAAARGWLRLVFLRVDERPVSFQFDLACNGNVYFLKSGYDPDYRQFSPGKLAMSAALEHEFASARTFEFLGSEEQYKLAWSNSCREKRCLEAFAPTAAGFVDWAAFAYARPLAKRLLKRRPDSR